VVPIFIQLQSITRSLESAVVRLSCRRGDSGSEMEYLRIVALTLIFATAILR
jgi:hypothetical protein